MRLAFYLKAWPLLPLQWRPRRNNFYFCQKDTKIFESESRKRNFRDRKQRSPRRSAKSGPERASNPWRWTRPAALILAALTISTTFLFALPAVKCRQTNVDLMDKVKYFYYRLKYRLGLSRISSVITYALGRICPVAKMATNPPHSGQVSRMNTNGEKQSENHGGRG